MCEDCCEATAIVTDCWYFAYGSNLNIDRKEQRTGKIREARRASLSAHRIVFNKLARDGTAYASIVPDPSRVVWGVAYRCSRKAIAKMDVCEGVECGHYRRQPIQVRCDSGEVLDAVAYVACEQYIRPSIWPSPEYLDRIVNGARQHGLPEDYIQEILLVAQAGR